MLPDHLERADALFARLSSSQPATEARFPPFAFSRGGGSRGWRRAPWGIRSVTRALEDALMVDDDDDDGDSDEAVEVADVGDGGDGREVTGANAGSRGEGAIDVAARGREESGSRSRQPRAVPLPVPVPETLARGATAVHEWALEQHARIIAAHDASRPRPARRRRSQRHPGRTYAAEVRRARALESDLSALAESCVRSGCAPPATLVLTLAALRHTLETIGTAPLAVVGGQPRSALGTTAWSCLRVCLSTEYLAGLCPDLACHILVAAAAEGAAFPAEAPLVVHAVAEIDAHLDRTEKQAGSSSVRRTSSDGAMDARRQGSVVPEEVAGAEIDPAVDQGAAAAASVASAVATTSASSSSSTTMTWISSSSSSSATSSGRAEEGGAAVAACALGPTLPFSLPRANGATADAAAVQMSSLPAPPSFQLRVSSQLSLARALGSVQPTHMARKHLSLASHAGVRQGNSASEVHGPREARVAQCVLQIANAEAGVLFHPGPRGAAGPRGDAADADADINPSGSGSGSGSNTADTDTGGDASAAATVLHSAALAASNSALAGDPAGAVDVSRCWMNTCLAYASIGQPALAADAARRGAEVLRHVPWVPRRGLSLQWIVACHARAVACAAEGMYRLGAGEHARALGPLLEGATAATGSSAELFLAIAECCVVCASAMAGPSVAAPAAVSIGQGSDRILVLPTDPFSKVLRGRRRHGSRVSSRSSSQSYSRSRSYSSHGSDRRRRSRSRTRSRSGSRSRGSRGSRGSRSPSPSQSLSLSSGSGSGSSASRRARRRERCAPSRPSAPSVAEAASPRSLMRLARAAARTALALECPTPGKPPRSSPSVTATAVSLRAGLHLSYAALHLGDPRAAANEARRVLAALGGDDRTDDGGARQAALDPTGEIAASARLHLAEALAATGNEDLAAAVLRECLKGGNGEEEVEDVDDDDDDDDEKEGGDEAYQLRGAAWANLAVALARAGDDAEALKAVAKARAYRSAGPEVLHTAAMAETLVLLQAGRTDDAIRVVRARTRVEQR